ncbi:MAG TPA: hypothetical protein VNW54_12745 [Granulicella sp.]|jgi:integrase/recombinase XerD|nr:hypothetical protein [Granulicella sp.]
MAPGDEIALLAARSGSPPLPVILQTAPDGGRRFWEFFTVNIRNPNTRRAYFKA